MLLRILQKTLAVLSKHERSRLIMLAITDVVISVLDITVLAALLFFIHAYEQPETGPQVPFLGNWFTSNHIVGSLVVLLLAFIIKNMAAYFAQKTRYNFVYSVAARISALNLIRYLEGSYHDYAGKDSAVHIRRISQQPVEFGHYVLGGFQQIFSESAMILLAVTAILLYNPTLFILLCVLLLPPLVLLSLYIKKTLAAARSNVKTSSEASLQHLKEALSGYIESNVFDKKDFFAARYGSKQQALNKYLAQLQSVQVLPPRLMETFAILGLALLIGVNELYLSGKLIPIITIGAFVAAAYKIIPSLVRILNATGQIKTYAFTVEDITSQNEIPQSPTTQKIQSLELKNISYNYADKKVVENFSLSARPGEIIGLTGISGKGKTTLLNLLLGFLEPNGGSILFNNTPATAAQRKLFWKNTSYVKQQPFLVHDSIATNISLSSNYNEQQLTHAINAAGLDKLIAELPGGLNTLITENGKNISGGQRQRIAFARALYKNADLLLLDEPFNELDEASEQTMLQYLQQLQQAGKIIILITHNSSSLSFCTKTVSLDA